MNNSIFGNIANFSKFAFVLGQIWKKIEESVPAGYAIPNPDSVKVLRLISNANNSSLLPVLEKEKKVDPNV